MYTGLQLMPGVRHGYRKSIGRFLRSRRRAAVRPVYMEVERFSAGRLLPRVDPLNSDESASNRTLKLHIREGDVDTAELRRIQTQGRPWLAMRAYVEWLVSSEGRMNQVLQRRDELVVRLRGMAGLQERAPEIVANLVVAFATFSDFLVSQDLLTDSRAESLTEECLNAVAHLMMEQHEVSTATAPEVLYLETLKALVLQGRAPLLDRAQRLDAALTGAARAIGWRDTEKVYLQPEAAHEAVSVATRTTGQNTSISLRDLFTRWVRRGWATPSTEERVGVQRSLGGGRPRVIEMPARLFEEVPAQPSGPAVEIPEADLVAALDTLAN